MIEIHVSQEGGKAVEHIQQFIERHGIRVLNVAGGREQGTGHPPLGGGNATEGDLLQQQHQGESRLIDCPIAACAIECGAALATINRRDFEHSPTRALVWRWMTGGRFRPPARDFQSIRWAISTPVINSASGLDDFEVVRARLAVLVQNGDAHVGEEIVLHGATHGDIEFATGHAVVVFDGFFLGCGQ